VPTNLADVVGGGRAAVLTMELQRGVVGDLSSFPELAAAVDEAGVIPATVALLAGARAAGVAVVHCTAGFRADRAGTMRNAPLISAVLRRPDHMLEGTAAVELITGLGPEPGDLISHRRHGVAPFGGTNLDATLRALGVSTVVATGVSLNLAILGLAVEAVGLGYRVVVATDAVAGVPPRYGEDVLRHTLALVATLATVAEIVAAFGPGAHPSS
jgi:nicotinamidase-related amidase